MNINTDNLIPMTEANQNFSKVARLVDQKGSVLILKNNVPRYLILDFQKIQEESTMPDEDVMAISRRLMKENKEAYEVLAK
ncbi:MAG: type II toxin-antitoxin system Phd/YefM family antitoxin [Selenomonadaceae bacterium]|nr:type II toxin-antitoxin system Phd/YefM family antitoxin [Selenomonadaceae bacterium]